MSEQVMLYLRQDDGTHRFVERCISRQHAQQKIYAYALPDEEESRFYIHEERDETPRQRINRLKGIDQ